MTTPDPTSLSAQGALTEAERLRVLRSFAPDALEDDPELCAIARFAAHLCRAPASQVTLVDDVRQRFIAREGITERETGREVSFCAYTMLTPQALVVPDARNDPRFASNPLVTGPPGVRFYAGHPLISEEGAGLGAVCVIDLVPRPEGLDALQREGLAVLAQAVMRRLQERRSTDAAARAIAEREERMKRIIEGVPQIAWSADAAGRFDYFNRRWREITGQDAPQVLEDWRPFLHPDDAPLAFAEWERCLAAGEPFEAEYRLRQADGQWAWVLGQAKRVADSGGAAHQWFGTITDIDEVHRALEARDMLAHELAHRIKNLFAVVIGLVTLRARQHPQAQPFAEELAANLHALARAHDFAQPDGGTAGESLKGLLAALFAPYRNAHGAARVAIAGEDAPISARSATPLALVFHELATNAAKYGALSQEDGLVTLTISQEGDTMVLQWRETGGPQAAGEGPPGFGTRLVDLSVTGQLQGQWQRHFSDDGMIVELRLPRAAL